MWFCTSQTASQFSPKYGLFLFTSHPHSLYTVLLEWVSTLWLLYTVQMYHCFFGSQFSYLHVRPLFAKTTLLMPKYHNSISSTRWPVKVTHCHFQKMEINQFWISCLWKSHVWMCTCTHYTQVQMWMWCACTCHWGAPICLNVCEWVYMPWESDSSDLSLWGRARSLAARLWVVR